MVVALPQDLTVFFLHITVYCCVYGFYMMSLSLKAILNFVPQTTSLHILFLEIYRVSQKIYPFGGLSNESYFADIQNEFLFFH